MDVSPLGLPFGRPHIEVLRLREDRASIQRQVEDLFRLEEDAATEVLLIRHAEPACNDVSNEDPLLSCTGLEQAERLGERLSTLWFDAIFAAPERRAQQTARLLYEATDSEVVTVEDLREIEYMPAAPQPWSMPSANYTAAHREANRCGHAFERDQRLPERLAGDSAGRVLCAAAYVD